MSIVTDEKTTGVNKHRRRVLQGVGAVAATMAIPAIASASKAATGTAEISGMIISKLEHPVKTMLVKNHSQQAVNIERFNKGGLVFDGELFDCNGACLDQSITLAPGEQKVLQFDTRRLPAEHSDNLNLQNVQSRVVRLPQGTRIVAINGSIHNGVATL